MALFEYEANRFNPINLGWPIRQTPWSNYAQFRNRHKGSDLHVCHGKHSSSNPDVPWSLLKVKVFRSGRKNDFSYKIPSNSKWAYLLPMAKHAKPPLRSCHDGAQHGQNLWEISDSHATHQQAAMLPALEAPVAVLAHLPHLQCGNLHSLLSINSISNIVESIIIGIGYDIILLWSIQHTAY